MDSLSLLCQLLKVPMNGHTDYPFFISYETASAIISILNLVSINFPRLNVIDLIGKIGD